MAKTIKEINERIKKGKAVVATAEEVIELTEKKGIKKAAPLLVQMFHEYKKYSELFLWAVGNALSEIDDKESYPEIIKICSNSALGSSRQMLFLKTLYKIKSAEAYFHAC